MAAQPSDEAIDAICNMIGIPRPEAIARLKGNNNDPNLAINEYLDNPGNNPYTWDESQFHTDRYDSKNSTGRSFGVQGPDDHGSRFFSGAPSRPPSPSSNRSPMGRVISLADEHQKANPRSRMNASELQDIHLQRALEQSAQEAAFSPQESGIVNTNVVHFGPANRSNYVDSQWAIIPVSTASAQDILPDPDPEDRKREHDVPAFIKPSVHGDRLASILTIFHEIPLAREIFLDRNEILPDYGHDPDWWSGKQIGYKSNMLPFSNGDSANRNLTRDGREMVHELQRIMAFLDKTERSYGSAHILTNLEIVSSAQFQDVETKFFEAWKYTHEDMPSLGSIFSQGLQPKDVEYSESSEDVCKDFAILDINLPNIDDMGELETLYDIFDKAFWSSSGLNIDSSAYLTHVGDIIVFRLIGTKSSRSIKIPVDWYPDRYLEGNREASLEMRRRKANIRGQMNKILALENKLNYYALPGGKTIRAKDLFNASMMHNAEPVIDKNVNGFDSLSVDTEMDSQLRVSDKLDVTLELHKVMASIDEKLKALDEEKKKARACLQELSKLYTEPSNNPNQPSLHRYTLRGVSTTKYVTYLRRQAEPDLIEMDLDVTESNQVDQWWKIEWSRTELKPIVITKVTQDTVLEAVEMESKTLVLIYANDRAMAEPVKPLPDPLETFVHMDNMAFSTELPYRHELQDLQSQMPSPVSPGKRKYDESSDSSTEAQSRYSETAPRWGGMSPLRSAEDVLVHQRELDGSDDSEINGSFVGTYDVPEKSHANHDPHGLGQLTFPVQVNANTETKGLVDQEMQEKKGMYPLLQNTPENVSSQPNYMESMDVDILASETHSTDQIDLNKDRAELE